ncbi:MAG: response regulator transcription factor [Ruminococcaceae bacterium]|nr:response regulator transcription factor [Oscillospiraceae bacterium]
MNYQMRIAICDDSDQDRLTMKALVAEYLDLHNYHIAIDEFSSGEAFLAADIASYDLAILDIFMGELTGIQTARQLVEDHPKLQIIFCSTSNAYAAESYDVSALRYFIKPISREKLFGTLDRFFHVHTSLRTLTYKQNRMDEHIYITDLLWVEADGHKSILHTRKGDITTRTPYSQICEELKDADFVRPIRYALVSLAAIATIPSDVLTLTDGSTVPISRDQRARIKQAFMDYKMRILLRKGGIPT